MSDSVVRIGGASGFWGDSQIAIPQLINKGNVQYLVFDYLAELTMSLLAAAKRKDPDKGYAVDFVEQIKPHIKQLLEKGIRVVSNAGGVNPHACAAALQAFSDEAGLSLNVAVVEGDNVLHLIPDLRKSDVREFQSGASLPDKVVTANAYLGARPIKLALDAGADIVITGRCVDSAVTLGVLMHHFSWSPGDYDKMAMGSLAGHIIECGCQATGGLHTDWRQVPDWANMGYPIVEVSPDAGFSVTKPKGTGGLVCVPAIAEQILYEVGNPAQYLLPDVICDFTNVKLFQQSDDRVKVEGAIGFSPTPTYKVCATYLDGYRAVAQLTIVGFDACAKAKRTAQAILDRSRMLFENEKTGDFTDTLVEILGSESAYGPHTQSVQPREVVMRLAVSHTSKEALQLFSREIAAAGTSWAPGTTGITGRPTVMPILKQFSFLLNKSKVPVQVVLGQNVVTKFVSPPPPDAAEQSIKGDPEKRAQEEAVSSSNDELISAEFISVPLITVAYARSGDKGDTCNIGVIARSPELIPYLRKALDPNKVKEYLSHLVKGDVTRFEVPGINAFNFLCSEALGGGGMASLRNDPVGKSMAQILLAMPVSVPKKLVKSV